MQALAENLDGKLCTAKFGRFWYVYLNLYAIRYIPESTPKILKTRLRLGDFKKTRHDMLDLEIVINGEENVCRFED